MTAETGAFATHYAVRGMVCSVDHVASAAGLTMLERGGSAADAAVATSAVLAVTTPHICGMGGDLFALVYPGNGPPLALNASGRAGSGADPDRLRTEGARTMPFRHDIRSVPVPGCVDGWLALHARFGRLPLNEVLAPALGCARDGFATGALLSALLPLVADVAGTDDFFRPHRLRPGEICRRAGVARALAAIVDEGRAGFYGGEFGAGLIASGAGEFAAGDLEAPLADWTTPISLSAFGHVIWTSPPNSQGYLTLASAWIADQLDLPDDPDDELWAHLLVEAARQAGHDRNAVLFEGADAAALLDRAQLTGRGNAIARDRASALPSPVGSGDTIYLCAIDGDGVGVSLIQSNAADFGPTSSSPGPGSSCTTEALASRCWRATPPSTGPAGALLLRCRRRW